MAAFATARLGEDEAAARAAARKRKPPWRAEIYADGLGGSVNNSPAGARPAAHDRGHVAETINGAVAQHIALHDPARALREVEAGRRILARHADCAVGNGSCEWFAGPGPCDDFADLLYRWAGHPDYRPAWKPA